jgi:hypothetical protein
LLDFDLVLPVVAEIVSVAEADVSQPAEVEQTDFPLVEDAGVIVKADIVDQGGIAVTEPADAELVQMGVPPI